MFVMWNSMLKLIQPYILTKNNVRPEMLSYAGGGCNILMKSDMLLLSNMSMSEKKVLMRSYFDNGTRLKNTFTELVFKML